MAILPPAPQRTVAQNDRALIAGGPGTGPAARARGMILPEADLAAAIAVGLATIGAFPASREAATRADTETAIRKSYAALEYFHHRLLARGA